MSKSVFLLLAALPAALAVAAAASEPVSAKLAVVPDLSQRLSRWKTVDMPFHGEGLTDRERRHVGKLVEASRQIEQIYWRQCDPEGMRLYVSLVRSSDPKDEALRRYLWINGSRFDLLDENKPFVGTEPMSPGRALYPKDITRAEIEGYVKTHPEQKAAIYSERTVVVRDGRMLKTIPYHVQYKPWLEKAARALREAAELSDYPSFANYLRLRAKALLTDDYYESDAAWVDLVDPKFDLILAPYETYLDDLLGVKGSYGAAVMIRNEEASGKLAVFQKYVPEIQEALPLAAEDKPTQRGRRSPMEVMDTPYRAGDLRHGYQAVADNLPNDPKIHEKKGSKRIFFDNFMNARVSEVIIPVSKRLIREDQARLVTGEGYLVTTMMHEVSHGIGPAFARVSGQKKDIRASIGPAFSGLEEAKADITGLFGLDWLIKKGALPEARRNEYYASHLGGIFRTVRFGVAEAHARAEMMEFNYFTEKQAITRDANGVYAMDFTKMPGAVASLAKELLEIEATGDRARAEAWFKRYEKMPPELKSALDKTGDIPVDIDPKGSFAEGVR